MIIYIVTKGEYSDYHICGVFTDPIKAQEAKKLYSEKCFETRVEEWEADIHTEHPAGTLIYQVIMSKDGIIDGVRQKSLDILIAPHKNITKDIKEENITSRTGNNSYMSFTVWATDEAHAIKIANERREQLIALNQ